jgi:hypothetical protein
VQDLVRRDRQRAVRLRRRDPERTDRRRGDHSDRVFGLVDAAYLANERAYRDLYTCTPRPP